MAGCPEEDSIRGAVAAFNAGDVEGYLAGFSANSLRWVSGLDTPLNLNDIRANMNQMTAAFDRLRLDEDLLFGAKGHVCARWTLRGNHIGDYAGIPPTHGEIAVTTCEVYTFTDATVSESWVYGDITDLFDQLKKRP